MISIDTNILLYSLNPASKWNSPAVEFLQQSFGDSSQRIVLCDYVLTKLYIILRNPAVMAKPLSAKSARDLVTSYLDIPNVRRVEHATVMDQVWELAGSKDFAQRRIFDARLALTLRHHGVTQFATVNVKDFQGWGFDQAWNPLIG
jgi:uncharacterized protein